MMDEQPEYFNLGFMNKDSQEEQPVEQKKATTKKPYVKPAFRYERIFETNALACMKMNTGMNVCMPGGKTS
jgi:hypothetical protein